MELQYNKLKGVKVQRKDYYGIVCGYKHNMIILAVKDCSGVKDRVWRRLDKDTFIHEDYKGSEYKYIYADIDNILKQEGLF